MDTDFTLCHSPLCSCGRLPDLSRPEVPFANPTLLTAYLFAEDLVGFAMDKAGLPWQRPFMFNRMRRELLTVFTPDIGEAVWHYCSTFELRLRPTFLEFCWRTSGVPKMSKDAVSLCVVYFAIVYLERRRSEMDFFRFCSVFVKLCLCFQGSGHLHLIQTAIETAGNCLNEMQLWKIAGKFESYDSFAKEYLKNEMVSDTFST